MPDRVKIIECPRDAWQGLPVHIPAPVKARYLAKLVDSGFSHIDAVSFVSPSAVPQMADSEDVLRELGPHPAVEIIGIVVNTRGAERAIASGLVQTLGFPYSISARFLRQNQNQTPERSMQELRLITELASQVGMDVVVYISMAFGNPYSEPWELGHVMNACELLMRAGVRQISLADTVGLAPAPRVGEVVGAVLAECTELEVGVHLHARPEEAEEKIRWAFAAGCRRFDGAIGGLGGCPYAQDALVGNVATETLVKVLLDLGANPEVPADLDGVIRANAEIVAKYGSPDIRLEDLDWGM